MLKIMKDKEEIVTKIFNEVEISIKDIISSEFKDFDSVTVKCHAYFVEVKLSKENRIIKFHLATTEYEPYKNQSKGKGFYLRKSQKSGQDYNANEIEEIKYRLQSLY